MSVREYRIRADQTTGRLVRRAVRVKRSGSSSTGLRGAQGLNESVVQGEAGGPVDQTTGLLDLDSLIQAAAQRLDINPDLIRAVIRQESAYDPYAVSSKGAKGLMQLMPATAKRFGVKDVFDPAENVRGGTEFLRQLLDRYDGDHRLALAAYNAGEAAVERYDGVPPYRETQDYIERIVGPSDPRLTAQGAADQPESVELRGVVATVDSAGGLLFEAE